MRNKKKEDKEEKAYEMFQKLKEAGKTEKSSVNINIDNKV